MTTHTDRYPLRTTELPASGQLWNWAQNSTIGAHAAVRKPRSEAELQKIVASTDGRIRVMGSRMSPGRLLRLAQDSDVLIDLGELRGCIDSTDDTATFAAGTTLQEVYDFLSARGRTLRAAPGVIAMQTLGGALATGTHGQGLHQSSIADDAVSVRMVLADGSVQDYELGDPMFPAVQLGLGALGIVTQVTLRTQQSVIYTCLKNAVSADTLESDIVGWNRDYAVSKAWWFPDENQVHVWAARESSADDERLYHDNGDELVSLSEVSAAMNSTIDRTLVHMRNDTKTVDANGKPYRTVTRFKDFSDVIGDVYQVFCRGIATPQINVEIAVPFDQAPAIIGELKAWHAENQLHMHYPIIIRCTGPSQSWLSPAHARETCFFGFVVYYAEDGTLSEDGLQFLRAVEEVLAARGGRPHWGKYFDPSLYDWSEIYPQMADFAAIRDRLDPSRKFENSFTAMLFS